MNAASLELKTLDDLKSSGRERDTVVVKRQS